VQAIEQFPNVSVSAQHAAMIGADTTEYEGV